MKKSIIFLILLFACTSAIAAEKVFEYGFEDWGGSIADTPMYPFSSHYGEYCEEHEQTTEVVTGYNGISPHSGRYFWLLNHGPDMVDPPEGITRWTPNAHSLIGVGDGRSANRACGQNPFDIDSIDTGEVFLRFWVVNSSWDAVNTDRNAKLKMVRYYEATEPDVLWMVYQNIRDNGRPQFGLDGPGHPFYSGSIPDFDDGNWHKCSMYVNYNTGYAAIWYDVEVETLSNPTISHDYGPGGIPGGPTPSPLVLLGNWSANNPTRNVYHALDDIEIWNGLPDHPTDPQVPNAPEDLTIEHPQ